MWPNPVDELYGDIVLGHYHKPHNRGSLKEPSVSAEVANVFCGDEVKLDVAIEDGRVTAVRFLGRGCSISQASASMLTEAVMGLSLGQVEALLQTFRSMMNGSAQVDAKSLVDLAALQGVRRFPARVKCAVLAWDALQKALELHDKAQT